MKLLKDFSEKELADFQKGQKIMTDMLKEFDNICRTNGLKYWCVGGTLIGTVRHKDWIPHDADIDVAMLKSDYEVLKKIIQKNLSKDYWFQDKSTDKYYKANIGKIRYLYAQYDDYKNESWHNGIQLDIFVFEDTMNDILRAPYEGTGDIKSIAKNVIFPLKELYFHEILVYVPNEYNKYCIDVWGSFPPNELPIEKQYPHEGRISFAIPEWMLKKYSNLYPTECKYIKYKNLDILFPNQTHLANRGEQVWVNYTGLTSERPNIIFNEINSLIKITPGMKILDIGCGCGEISIEFYIKYKDSIQFTGIDVVSKLIQINQINMKEYLFLNGNDFTFSQNYDIIMCMGYGDNLNKYIEIVTKLKNTKYLILESHTGKIKDFNTYNNMLILNYNIIYDKILNCGNNWALQKRRLVIYKLK